MAKWQKTAERKRFDRERLLDQFADWCPPPTSDVSQIPLQKLSDTEKTINGFLG
jgi:hypothetical protein